MLQVKNLSFSYRYGKKVYEVMKNINIDIAENEFCCIVGPSGCGKSTLLKLMAGFETPTEGEIIYNGELVKNVHYDRAMVFQEDAVFPWMTVLDNVAYGLKSRNISNSEDTAEKMIKLVGLSGCNNMLPKELSGGMKKRVDLARVLANDPNMLLMDEPFGALDALTKEKLQESLVKIWQASRKTIAFVTHDIEEALFLADKIFLLPHIKSNEKTTIIDIPFKRPRDIFIKEEPSFQKLRREIVVKLKSMEIV